MSLIGGKNSKISLGEGNSYGLWTILTFNN
ncbi:hypothetical protein SAMN05444274_103273 [Mariniphaga anaerophila]|uniref:Uncharacterized protein n=1 Tax=Mariniphaga anaerophila TaxID=1484053 RepID=A0A1M4Y8F2_9BACT|nr:hypothetical protein SAMN05444274_103273 [Mariniphaga anaerophila]